MRIGAVVFKKRKKESGKRIMEKIGFSLLFLPMIELYRLQNPAKRIVAEN